MASGRWQASYLDPRTASRVMAPSTFATKSDAGTWLTSIEADLTRGELPDPSVSRRPFGEWAEEWLQHVHVKPKTYVAYEGSLRNHVLPAFKAQPIAGITYRDCKAFVDGMLAARYAPGTVSEARKVLRLVLAE